MFVRLTDAKEGIPLLVNLDMVLYAYRPPVGEVTALVFGKLADPGEPGGRAGARVRNIAVTVVETLQQIQEKRRMASP
ncbi:MAG: hypothetical protein ACYS8L_08080 [Planctomycetota bacterium]|jgi:hypothetical protein